MQGGLSLPAGALLRGRQVRPLRRPDHRCEQYCHDDLETVCRTIRNKLIAGVDKRLDADAPLGFLLSGGLDSSLVCAISALVLGKKIRTFAIGMDKDAIDLKYAREVADYIGADHTEVIHDPPAGAGYAGGGDLPAGDL